MATQRGQLQSLGDAAAMLQQWCEPWHERWLAHNMSVEGVKPDKKLFILRTMSCMRTPCKRHGRTTGALADRRVGEESLRLHVTSVLFTAPRCALQRFCMKLRGTVVPA